VLLLLIYHVNTKTLYEVDDFIRISNNTKYTEDVINLSLLAGQLANADRGKYEQPIHRYRTGIKI